MEKTEWGLKKQKELFDEEEEIECEEKKES